MMKLLQKFYVKFFCERKAFFYFLVVYACILLPTINGIGQYWDSSFPYFTDQIKNFFNYQSYSWTIKDIGVPLGYSSDYFFRFFVSLFTLFPPEILKYLVTVTLLAIGSYGIFLITKKYTSVINSYFIALIAFINPAVIYKLWAGHFNYILSLVVFIFLLHYLLFYFKHRIKDYVVLGFFVALVGAQIQFFIFSAILISVFLFREIKKVSIKGLLISILIPILTNMFWILNFIISSDFTKISQEAANVSFKDSSTLEILDVLTLTFSKATLIAKFYPAYILILSSTFFILLLFYFIRNYNNFKKSTPFQILFLIYFIFSLGFFFSFNLPFISILEPMFREVGHVAPLIILFALLWLAALVGNTKVTNKILISFFSLFLISNLYVLEKSLPLINFSEIREQFSEFKKFSSSNDSISKGEKVLFYPFFDQYGFNTRDANEKDNFRLSNTGKDSFMAFSDIRYLQNVIPPHKFKDSVQYDLLINYDISTLDSYGVKYLFDFSDIYSSYYYKYVPKDTYDNNLSLIENNPDFFNRILAQNPDRVKKISKHIYEILDVQPYISIVDKPYSVTSTSSSQVTRDFFEDMFDYRINTMFPRSGVLESPFIIKPYSETRIENSKVFFLSNETQAKIFYNENIEPWYVKNDSGEIILQQKPLFNTFINGVPIKTDNYLSLYINDFSKTTFKPKYYVGNNVSLYELKIGDERLLSKKVVIIQAEPTKSIINGDFESGLWQQKIQDCYKINDYNTASQELIKDSGNSFIKISTKSTLACTRTPISNVGKGEYIFSFEVRSSELMKVPYYIQFNDENKSIIKNFFQTNTSWETINEIITVPDGATEGVLYIYSEPNIKEEYSSVEYDNFSFNKIINQYEPIFPEEKKFNNEIIELTSGTNTISRFNSDDKNLIDNPSFESEGWTKSVEDCYKIDDNPNIEMNIVDNVKTDGQKSLVLKASNHVACTKTGVKVIPNTKYNLSFDYMTNSKENASIAILYQGISTIETLKLPSSENAWLQWSKIIEIPGDVNSIQIYLYASPLSDKTYSEVHYDNFHLHKIDANVFDYYLISQDEENIHLKNTERVNFKTVNPTKHTVSVSNISKPFYLAMSESYHPQWQAQFNNEKINGFFRSWIPWVKPDVILDEHHFELNGFLNGWYIDIDEHCIKKQLCTKNADGSYDMELTLEFTPQRWFYLGLLISGTTLAGCLIFLVYDRTKRWRLRRQKYHLDLRGKK